MSQLLIKQKVFSWTDTYDVYDQSGNPKYYVKADFFSIGHRIRVYDKASGREIGLIQEKILRLFKEFEITINGFSQGIIKKQFSFFRPKYNIDYKGWRLVVHISKQLFKWGDTYVIDIINDMDEVPALMIAIAMDAAKCSEDESRNSMM